MLHYLPARDDTTTTTPNTSPADLLAQHKVIVIWSLAMIPFQVVGGIMWYVKLPHLATEVPD